MINGRLPNEEVRVKLSICGKCNGVVRVAVVHMMTEKGKTEFAKEAMQYNLSIKEQSLLDYDKSGAKWCECKG